MADYLPPAAPTTQPDEGSTGLPIKWPELPDSVNPILVRAWRMMGRRGFKSLLRLSALLAFVSTAIGCATRFSTNTMVFVVSSQVLTGPHTFFAKLADMSDAKGWACDFLRLTRLDPKAKVMGKFLTLSMCALVIGVAITLCLLGMFYFPWGAASGISASSAIGWGLILWAAVALWQAKAVRIWAEEHALRTPKKKEMALLLTLAVATPFLLYPVIGLVTDWPRVAELYRHAVESTFSAVRQVDWKTGLGLIAVAAVGIPINLTLSLAALQPENPGLSLRRATILVFLQALLVAVAFQLWVGVALLLYGLHTVVRTGRKARASLVRDDDNEATSSTNIPGDTLGGVSGRGPFGFGRHGAVQFPDGWNPILLRQVRGLTRGAVPTFFLSTGFLTLAIALLFYPWLSPLPDVLAGVACIIPIARIMRNLKAVMGEEFELLRPTRLSSWQIIVGMWMSASIGLPTSLASGILYLFIRSQIMPANHSWHGAILASQGYIWGVMYFLYSTVGQVQSIYSWSRAVHKYRPDWPSLRNVTTTLATIAGGGLILWRGGPVVFEMFVNRLIGIRSDNGMLLGLVALVFLHMAFVVHLSIAALEGPHTQVADRALKIAGLIGLVQVGLVALASPLAALGLFLFEGVILARRYGASAEKSGEISKTVKA